MDTDCPIPPNMNGGAIIGAATLVIDNENPASARRRIAGKANVSLRNPPGMNRLKGPVLPLKAL